MAKYVIVAILWVSVSFGVSIGHIATPMSQPIQMGNVELFIATTIFWPVMVGMEIGQWLAISGDQRRAQLRAIDGTPPAAAREGDE